MTAPERPFLDFYEKHKIIPTSLEITHKQKFFTQRNYLFETLGIPTRFLNSTRILELGPGTGQKAEHLLSLNPASYTAIDNNPESIKSTQDMIDKSGYSGTATVTSADFSEYVDSNRYDLVLAELVVITQHDPLLFLGKLVKLLRPGGVLVYTCSDSISLLSEILRRAIVNKLELVSDNLRESADAIANFFRPDLNSLDGMNRSHTDWAIDQIIKPTIGPQMTIADSLQSFQNEAVFHGSSPRFVEDYRWYKDPDSSIESLNSVAIENFWAKCHNFIDYRFNYKSLSSEVNQEIYAATNRLYSTVAEAMWSHDSEQIVTTDCQEIQSLISENCQETNLSLESFLKYWRTKNVLDLEPFRPWWGRGTQYMSVMKRHDS
ncbi:MAG: methyltransferase domain-containing protein [Actinobacteria bacterium]|uniref:Unannotated protein n=1 Tax=freshwater metagenome TaxID=449393 RepID=A0A6J6TS94_9ZZZZ|nr:methyltransferase domain-containing protein [Actinomycetota bacterium]